jgi:putative phosphoesterase
MKIGLLSDIHVDINNSGRDDVTPAICDSIKNQDIDIFITAGDVSSDYRLTLETVGRIEKETGRDCLFVSGNHDLWNEKHPDMTACETYSEMLKHPHNLSAGPVKLKDGWSAAGETCWYDYSFGSAGLFTFSDFERRSYEGRVWQDSIKAVWNRTDAETHDWFLRRLEDSITRVNTGSIIAVTHMLPVEEFTVPVPDETWDYFNAFLGSREIGEMLFRHPNVKYAVSGHVHYRKEAVKNGQTFICQCLGYRTEWKDNDDPFIEVPKSMRIIEI